MASDQVVRGLFLVKRNFDNRFPALEPVFPGNDEADGGAILRGEFLVIHARDHERQGMHRFNLFVGLRHMATAKQGSSGLAFSGCRTG